MPSMSYTPKSINDKSQLTDGWHPAFLLAITDEPTPEGWQMAKTSPRMWRWTFAVWASPDVIDTVAPERQSAPSSQSFTPKGKNPASKAYSWTRELLGRDILPGEVIDLDPFLPLSCRVKVARNGEYANIVDLEAWQHMISPGMREALQGVLNRDGTAPPRQEATGVPPGTGQPRAQQPTLPGMPAPMSRW